MSKGGGQGVGSFRPQEMMTPFKPREIMREHKKGARLCSFQAIVKDAVNQLTERVATLNFDENDENNEP